jgi:acyl transferase domain-containing protein
MLKLLSHACADGDRVLALVRATGCNQDGRTDGITVPNGNAQRALMATVLHRAGLIKIVLCLRERQLPPVAGLETLNPAIDFSKLNLLAPRTLLPLPQDTLRMAINSFGYGGTNAHAILEAAPEKGTPTIPARDDAWGLLPISARSEEALAELVQRWSKRLADSSEPLRPLLSSAALRRSHHDYRVAFAGRSHEELRSGIHAWLESKPRAERPLRDRRVVFVYTGMGPQWWGMARELLTRHAPSQAVATEFDGLFRKTTGGRW